MVALSSVGSADVPEEEALILKVFHYMLAGSMLPLDMILEEAYPFLKGLIIINPARWQNLEGIGVMQQHCAGEHFEEFPPPPEQQHSVQELLSQNPRLVPEWSEASQEKGMRTFIREHFEDGITGTHQHDVDDSVSLAKKFQFFVVAIEKLNASARSRGVIQFVDDIALNERELDNLDMTKRTFGLVDVGDGDHAVENDLDTQNAEIFPRNAMHMILEDRVQLITSLSDDNSGTDEDNRKRDAAQRQIDVVADRLDGIMKTVSPVYFDLEFIQQQFQNMIHIVDYFQGVRKLKGDATVTQPNNIGEQLLIAGG